MVQKQSSLQLVVNQSAMETHTVSEVFDFKEKKEDHQKLIDYYIVSKKLRNHSKLTIDGTHRILDKFFDITNRLLLGSQY